MESRAFQYRAQSLPEGDRGRDQGIGRHYLDTDNRVLLDIVPGAEQPTPAAPLGCR